MSRTTDHEHAPRWRKASSSAMQGNCVEVARLPDAVWVRNSRDLGGPELRFTPREWEAFVDGVKSGEFDDLL